MKIDIFLIGIEFPKIERSKRQIIKTRAIVYIQKQPSRGVLRKRCSANIKQIYRGTPISKCEFDKVAL